MTSPRQMIECRRTARRLQQFLDRDPSAPLSDGDRQRVQAHLDVCARCTGLAREYQELHASLRDYGQDAEPTPEAVDRVRQAVQRALAQE
ncbi:MAG: zf-HC2 domain-containing protein [Candidatus Nanopelagicales bacterium]|nr:zf-HC2 domain-containing protein [Candidatus Nanopelagicales bacterium]